MDDLWFKNLNDLLLISKKSLYAFITHMIALLSK